MKQTKANMYCQLANDRLILGLSFDLIDIFI